MMLARVSSILTMLVSRSWRDEFMRGHGVPGGIRTPNRLIRSQKLYPVELQALYDLKFEICNSRSGARWGGQRDSNPQQPEPQSGALPLSYDHRLTQILGLRFAIAKAKVGAALAVSSSLGRIFDRTGSLFVLGSSVLGTLFAPATAVVLLLSIATGADRVILALRPRMTRLGSLLLAGLLIAVVTAQAQSDDPSETFLKAYMTSQQGEKLERDGQFTRALAKYRFAGSLLEELKKTHSDWQPAIVEYRSR